MLPTGIPETRLLVVHCQLSPLQHPTRPIQCLFRLSATENHKIVRIVHDLRSNLFPAPGLPPALQHPVHVQIGERRTDHATLWGATIPILATRQPAFPVVIPLLNRNLQPHLDQMQHVPVNERHFAAARSAGWCRSTSTNPRQRYPYTLRAAVHRLSELPSAHSSAAGSRKHSDPTPLPRSAPRPTWPRFAPPGPEWSESPVAFPRLRAFQSLPVAPVVVEKPGGGERPLGIPR